MGLLCHLIRVDYGTCGSVAVHYLDLSGFPTLSAMCFIIDTGVPQKRLRQSVDTLESIERYDEICSKLCHAIKTGSLVFFCEVLLRLFRYVPVGI